MLSNELTRIWVTWRDCEPADIRAYAQGFHDYVELKRFTSDEQLFRWLSLHELCLAFTSELDEDPIKRVGVALRTRIVPLATRCA